MEYIILDLEWDSVYFKPKQRFINQILQIGAVKLDENFNTIDTFSKTIRSSISKKVTGRFAELTGITKEIMLAGIPFEQAVREYNEFAKNADVTMTWSTSDLYTILDNEENLLKDEVRFKFKNYLDLQKLVQSELRKKGYDNKNQISLEGAAEFLGFDISDFSMHTAVDDCKVSAVLFKKCYNADVFNQLKRDASAPDFFARIRCKPHPISNINDSAINKSELEFNCPECGGKSRRLNPFKYRNRWFVSNFKCEQCGFKFNGRVSFKKTFDDVQVKRKVCEYRRGKKNGMQPMPKTVQSTANRNGKS